MIGSERGLRVKEANPCRRGFRQDPCGIEEDRVWGESPSYRRIDPCRGGFSRDLVRIEEDWGCRLKAFPPERIAVALGRPVQG